MTEKKEKKQPKASKQLQDTQVVQQTISSDSKTDTVALEGGKFCLDVAKLVFAGVILAGIMKEDSNTILLYTIGVIVVLFFIAFGFYLIKKSKIR